ncbi:SIMPL domain-containing protein [Peribacillus simplex]|uniref:SIMPL domain-containing protein n=1 Tax=Peribacillus simplex TaxID=1478 RepID=UPI00298E62DB|nr:SIMPL domain-containing protein [Peribacillus simplex]MDW7613648.1 SIMPL domain-containing protein [Peribacillus simplex]
MNQEYNAPDRDYYRNDEHTLRVSGSETLQAAPDQAIITLGVITEDKDPQKAQQANSQAIANVIASLKSAGIPEEQLKTSDYRIDPQYDYIDGKELFKNYKVQHMIQAQTTDIEKIGSIIDTAVRSGANSITSIRFSLSNPEAYYNRALSLALKKAYEKALSMARTIGFSLNPIPNQVDEVSETTTPIHFQTSTFSKMASTPIQPGELNITASVRVVYTY